MFLLHDSFHKYQKQSLDLFKKNQNCQKVRKKSYLRTFDLYLNLSMKDQEIVKLKKTAKLLFPQKKALIYLRYYDKKNRILMQFHNIASKILIQFLKNWFLWGKSEKKRESKER